MREMRREEKRRVSRENIMDDRCGRTAKKIEDR